MTFEALRGPKARVRIHHEVAYDFDQRSGLWLTRAVDEDEIVENLLLDAARLQLHTQCYGTAGLLANGLNYVGLSNDAAAPAATDVVLAAELSGDGLTRAQGTVTLPTGTGTQTTIEKAFTYLGVLQLVQKSALFSAVAGGIMGHEVQFTQRSLATNDLFTVTYTITFG